MEIDTKMMTITARKMWLNVAFAPIPSFMVPLQTQLHQASPISNLYPTPQTVLMSQSFPSTQSFARILLMWLSTARVSPRKS
jgi:hypothetical protein